MELDPTLPWLLLVYQAPARPTNVRVKAWRRLQDLGAVAVRNSVYVLPNSAQAREDFEWLKTEIDAMKGGATVLAAASVDAVSRDEIIGAFRAARRQNYAALDKDVRAWLRRASALAATDAGRQTLARALRQLDERLARVRAIDFFAAEGAEDTAALVAALRRRVDRPAAASVSPSGRLDPAKFRKRTWVTRPRPGIDRMSSAWLIRRFIDPAARFVFRAPSSRQRSTPARAIPFDMFGVEFGHQGHSCTFETLVRRFGLDDPALPRIAALVHVLDLKDDCPSPPEAPAFARLVEGLRQAHANDRALLEQGMAMFEALYRSLSSDDRP